jgi:3-dehydroquinate synthetase
MKELAAELKKYKQVFVVCDRNVEDFARKVAGLRTDARTAQRGTDSPLPQIDNLLPITADEGHKTMDTVMNICRWLRDCGADRDALVLAVGGGVTTDMAGFAASIYKRGIRYANIPTTLLSMVDAGIGGKTGVNLDGYKNLLGVIRQPEFTAIFPEVLETLPERELRSGLAEMLKTFLIKNPRRAYERTVAFFQTPCSGDCPEDSALLRNPFRENAPLSGQSSLSQLIHQAAAIKQAIVEKDEFETGLRRKLNLGHTWAHAIEWWQKETGRKEQFTHGEAVAIGMAQAAKYAESLGIAEEPGLADRIAADLKACGLPTELPCPEQELLPAILKDKKAYGSKIKLVLPCKIGKVVVKSISRFCAR